MDNTKKRIRVRLDSWAWIYRKDISKTTELRLRRLLTVYPLPGRSGDVVRPIFSFRVTENWFGIPREYFLQNRESHHDVYWNTTEGENKAWADQPVEFDGRLRVTQAYAAEEILNGLSVQYRDGGDVARCGGVVRAPTGYGKCLALGTKILLVDGNERSVEDLKPGDELLGPDSLPRRVTSVARGAGALYRIMPRSGCSVSREDSWVCNKDHILTLIDHQSGAINDVSLAHWMTFSFWEQGSWCLFSPPGGVEFKNPTHLENPYGLGATPAATEQWPAHYLTSTKSDRRHLLAGFIDASDQTLPRGDIPRSNAGYDVRHASIPLLKSVQSVARSLGFYAKVYPHGNDATLRLLGDFREIPFKADHEIGHIWNAKSYVSKTNFEVESIGEGEWAGFTLTGDGRFLLWNYTVTHNTVLACYLIAQLKVPTLVLVHTEPLLDQWEARIKTFLPDSKIGRIQGDICDVDGRHVAIGMIQSLSKRDYSLRIMDWPGLVITDECHHVAAPVWGKVISMFRAKYRIGLTATPNRKDETEDIFFWHIGSLIYYGQELRLNPKIVRIETTFDLFRDHPYLREMLKIEPRLINLLCDDVERNRLIVSIVLEAASNGRQILVLSKRRKHLVVLSRMFAISWGAKCISKDKNSSSEEKNLAHRVLNGSNGDRVAVMQLQVAKKIKLPRMGQCVGGISKQVRDDLIENAQILWATYSYVSEGFDIPRLDTLVMACPVSDCAQSSGRILRPHDGKQEPLIYDLRDGNIPVFQSYARNRDAIYVELQQG